MDKSKDRKKKAKSDDEDNVKKQVGEYMLFKVIGKGAFGVVYKAVHLTEGSWVAIKQVRLNKKKRAQLNSLMMEIDLLKSLTHENIVHYMGHNVDDSNISIIMEYVENGSLEGLLKGGILPETLVRTYMREVVTGLDFLHEQGVIHRDIKGANILITTAGKAKLADFGVSTKLSDISNPEESFAGTPYWMAPEIITMSGATTACDIWSVGCTILELMTGNPPYGNLPPAASLYRIVQDDHPPLPSSISSHLEDLLMQCFKKDVKRRISAKGILKHTWMKKSTTVPTLSPPPDPSANVKDSVLAEIEEYNKALDDFGDLTLGSLDGLGALGGVGSVMMRDLSSIGTDDSELSGLSEKFDNALNIGSIITRPVIDFNDDGWDSSDDDDDDDDSSVGGRGTIVRKVPSDLTTNDESTDDDPLGLGDDDVDGTVVVRPVAGVDSVVDIDWSPSVSSEEDGSTDGGVKEKPSSASEAPLVLKLSNASYKPELDLEDLDDAFDFDDSDEGVGELLLNKPRQNLDKWIDHGDDGAFDDGFDFDGSDGGKLSLHPHEADSEDDVGLDELQFSDDDEEDSGESLAEQMLLFKLRERQKAQVQTVISGISGDNIAAACVALQALLARADPVKTDLVPNTALIQLIDVLRKSSAANDTLHLLKLFNHLFEEKDKQKKQQFQVNLCLLGGLPAIAPLASRSHPIAVRLEAAYLIRTLCGSNPLVLHMFVACGGLSYLTDMLEPDYKKFKSLVLAAVDGVWSIFQLQILSRNEFCDLFVKTGSGELLARLSTSMVNLHDDKNARAHLKKASDIFFYFSQASLNPSVQSHMADQVVLHAIRKVLVGGSWSSKWKIKPSYWLMRMLHVVRNMCIVSTLREALVKTHFIEVLVVFLNRQKDFSRKELRGFEDVGGVSGGKITVLKKMHNQVLNAMYPLCQLDKDRQTRAAKAGIVPALVWFIQEGEQHFLSEMAITILLEFPHASTRVRSILWKSKSIGVFLDLLRDRSWFVDGLVCFQKWLQLQTKKIETTLCDNVDDLISIFDDFGGEPSFKAALDPLRNIADESGKVNRALASAGIIERLLKSLERNKNDAGVRLNLLKFIYSICSNDPRPEKIVSGMKKPLAKIVKADKNQMSIMMAKRILDLK